MYVALLGDTIAWKTVVFRINNTSGARKTLQGENGVKFLAARVVFIQRPQFSMPSYVNTIAKGNSSFLQLRKP